MVEAESIFRGLVAVARKGPQGMITLRGDLAAPHLAAAVQELTGHPVPGPRRINASGDEQVRGVAWMSPDEALVFVPHAEAGAAVARLQAALAQDFALVADVSDARAMFHLRGPAWREVLARLCPVDFAHAAFGPGDLRRTRAAQVAAAIWAEADDAARLICFRSVAVHVAQLLQNAADPSGETGLYRQR